MSATSQEPRMRFLEVGEAVSRLKAQKSKVALMTLAIYVDGAIEQWKRAEKDEQDANEQNALAEVYEAQGNHRKRDETKNRFWAIKNQELIDMHLYFICADKVGGLTIAIVCKEGRAKLAKFWSKWHHKMFKEIRDTRNGLEHPLGYLGEEGEKGATFVLLFDKRFYVRNHKVNLKEIGPENLATFFDKLISLVLSSDDV